MTSASSSGTEFDDVRVAVLPGRNLVVRESGVVALVCPDHGEDQSASNDQAVDDQAAIDELLEILRGAAQGSGGRPGRHLAGRLTRWVLDRRGGPSVGTISATEDGVAVFLHGAVRAVELPETGAAGGSGRDAEGTARGQERVELSGRKAAFTVDRLLPWPAGRLQLSADLGTDREPGPGTGPGTEPGGDGERRDVTRWTGLLRGAVPGGGVVLDPRVRAAVGAPAAPDVAELGALGPVPMPHPLPEDDAAEQTISPVRPPAPEASPPVTPPLPEAPPAVTPPVAEAPPPVTPPVAEAPQQAPKAPPLAPLPVPGAPPPPLRPPRLAERILGAPLPDPPRKPLPLGAGAAPPAPGPGGGPVPRHAIVKGFRCSRNHINDPRAAFCSVCGIRMDQRTGILVDGRRPPLGLLVLDVGATFVLDDDYLLGRNPEVDHAVAAGRLRPIRLDDDSGTLSRVHAEIRLQDWDVLLVDRGSANGTYVAAGGQQGWTRLQPRRPLQLRPGTHVRVGRRTFTFESSAAHL